MKVGTIFEGSHVALRLWLQAIYLIASSKKGISSQQLHRTLGVTLKTAWFMANRTREAMREGGLGLMGGNGSIVATDETYYGPTKDQTPIPTVDVKSRLPSAKTTLRQKRAILGLVERGGKVRSFHMAQATKENVAKLVSGNVHTECKLMTDESHLYRAVRKSFQSYDTTSAGEYVRYDCDLVIHFNTIEDYFSVFKRGMRGVYQHCDEKHLHRYLSEFDFRYYNRIGGLGVGDLARADGILTGAVGRRPTYETTSARWGADGVKRPSKYRPKWAYKKPKDAGY